MPFNFIVRRLRNAQVQPSGLELHLGAWNEVDNKIVENISFRSVQRLSNMCCR